MEDPHRPIKDKQIEMSKQYSSDRPSTHEKIAWIYAVNTKDYPQDTPRSGKWCLFVPVEKIDTV